MTVTFPGGLTYTPGVKQTLTVTVSDAAQRRWGFELTARQSGNSKAQAGTFIPGSDGYTQLICANTAYTTESQTGCPTSSLPLVYIEHTSRGTQSGKTGSGSFTFQWTPPSSDVGNVVLYVPVMRRTITAARAATTNYTNKYTLTAAAATPKPAISQSGVVDGASYQPGITAGSWISIQGTNLSKPSERTWRAD